MSPAQIAAALEMIRDRHALLAGVEYELEDMGLIVTDDGPYARLTPAGHAYLASRVQRAELERDRADLRELGL